MLSNFKLTGFVSRQTTAPAVCGNGKCETGEDVFSCPQDCPQVDQSVTELIPPRNVDVSTCTDGKGNIYPTEGASNYARWFIWNGCVAKKMFALSNTVGVANKPLILYVYGDSCATCKCQNPNFDVYEARGDGAYKVASINLSNQPVSSGAGQTTNLHSYFYAPESYAFFIATEAHSCFYMKVYQGDEASLKRNFPSWENLPVNIQGPISM